jgi:hypothetical protein
MQDRLLASGAMPGVKVSFAPDLEAQLVKMYQSDGAASAYENVASRLYAELQQGALSMPSKNYEVGFSRGLTSNERKRALDGDVVHASSLFQVSGQTDDGTPIEFTFPLSTRWEDVVARATQKP